eukprot:scaffold172037_cov15-Tisochrysis_lutea.AAC.1
MNKTEHASGSEGMGRTCRLKRPGCVLHSFRWSRLIPSYLNSRTCANGERVIASLPTTCLVIFLGPRSLDDSFCTLSSMARASGYRILKFGFLPCFLNVSFTC